MMLIDTHCHLYLEQFQDDIDAVLERAVEAGVKHIFMPAINPGSLSKMEQLHHPDIHLHKMAGLHPTGINEGESIDENDLFESCQNSDIVGVGETGLDYYWSSDYKKKQKKSLRMHCKVAKAVDKPVILHNRESTADLLSIIEEEQDGTLKGVWHSFNGSADEGKRTIDLGLHLGIGGIFTFKNAGVDQSVAELPLKKMILETDAPYLAPEPKRGKRNEPAFVKHTARRLAEVMELSLKKISKTTSETALKLFEMQ